LSLGLIEGADDGLAVGNGEGAGEGGLDGTSVGLWEVVGETVGALVGDLVGGADGDAVGQPLQEASHSSDTLDPEMVWPHQSPVRFVILLGLAVNQEHVRSTKTALYSYCPKT
jgi:phage tail tape-measure protein